MKRVLALNGSPRGENSNTQALLTPLLEGMCQAGAETETLVVRDLDIGFCRGCFGCWFGTPGRCVQNDDMEMVIEKMSGTDYIILGTPLYHFGMTALLKRLIERTLPFADPHMVEGGDRTNHPLRAGRKAPGRYVLLANCGFPEAVHFGALVEHLRYLSGGDRPAASIVVPSGETLGRRYDPNGEHKWFFDALRQAGRELIEQGSVSDSTMTTLNRPLLPPQVYRDATNASFDRALQGKQ